ncbi:MAG TPA: hypothetical protein VM054_11455 [bacterium]|nr:hypothetical protein [bacterium]
MGRLPEDAERVLAGIASDTAHGAAELHARALGLASGLSAELLPAFGEALLRGRRDMAPLKNLALALIRSPDPAGELGRQITSARRAPGVIASKVRALVGSGRRVITISRSSTVLAVLGALEPERVLCLESSPGGEGRRFAALLYERGIPAETVPDGDLEVAVKRVELGLCGADTVTELVFVNKIGTRRLAEGLRALGKPLYVAADRTKYLPAGYYEPPVPGGPFEEIPRSLVAGLIDDSDDTGHASG